MTEIPDSVKAMRVDGSPTAPLGDFLAALEADYNWWWRIDCHHQNLFDAAIERIEELAARLAERR